MVIESSKASQELYSKLTNLSQLIKLNIYCVTEPNSHLFKIEFLNKPSILPSVDFLSLRSNHVLSPLQDEVLIYSDETSLHYMIVKHFHQNMTILIVIGPFLYEFPSENFIEDYLLRKNIPLKDKHILSNYYSSVKLLESAYVIGLGKVLATLIKNPCENPNIQHMKVNSIVPLEYVDYEELEETSNAIDFRYTKQNQLFHFVENGQTEEALAALSEIKLDLEGRAKTPLRALKNLVLVLNTTLRLAAEKGGVSPYQIHIKSSRFAIIIEDLNNIQSLLELQKKMVISYCKLVNRTNTRGLSKPIMDAVHYIENHLDQKISLLDISQYASINDSHLSRQFKKETGKTVTEYINDKKIHRAIYYLENTKYSITEISVMCGFENHNYFSKIFKKKTGFTPREYQKNNPLI